MLVLHLQKLLVLLAALAPVTEASWPFKRQAAAAQPKPMKLRNPQVVFRIPVKSTHMPQGLPPLEAPVRYPALEKTRHREQMVKARSARRSSESRGGEKHRPGSGASLRVFKKASKATVLAVVRREQHETEATRVHSIFSISQIAGNKAPRDLAQRQQLSQIEVAAKVFGLGGQADWSQIRERINAIIVEAKACTRKNPRLTVEQCLNWAVARKRAESRV